MLLGIVTLGLICEMIICFNCERTVRLTINQGLSVNRNSGRTWVNFKDIRAKLKMEEVLRLYDIAVKSKDGVQHVGQCPLPGHTEKRDITSFSANLKLGIFQCFGCGAKGNVLEFAALMDSVDPNDGSKLRKVAVKLRDQLHLDGQAEEKELTPAQQEFLSEDKSLPIVVNAPLDFQLKGLLHTHESIQRFKVSAETAHYFGVGVCSRGLLQDCIAIPLHSNEGELIGYAGRPVSDCEPRDDISRYSLPRKRNRKGTILDFQKSLFLYNAHRMTSPVDTLTIVEGFVAVWWLHQNGIRNVVSTMGPEISDSHVEKIKSLVSESGCVQVVSACDGAGERAIASSLMRIAPHRSVRWKRLEPGHQPQNLCPEELAAHFAAK